MRSAMLKRLRATSPVGTTAEELSLRRAIADVRPSG